MAIEFDVGELSSELAKLRSRPQLHKLAIVLPISPGQREESPCNQGGILRVGVLD